MTAGPPSASYKLRKFMKRYKGQVLAACMIGALLALGMIGTGYGLVWALQEKQRATDGREQVAEPRPAVSAGGEAEFGGAAAEPPPGGDQHGDAAPLFDEDAPVEAFLGAGDARLDACGVAFHFEAVPDREHGDQQENEQMVDPVQGHDSAFRSRRGANARVNERNTSFFDGS